MIHYAKHGFRIGEVWFDEEPEQAKVDILKFLQRSQPVPDSLSNEKWSIQVDLTQDEGQLFGAFKKGTRYEARRAFEKDRVSFAALDGHDRSVLDRFCCHYNRFADARRLPRADASRLKLYEKASMLTFTCVCDGVGEELVWHSYLACGDHARLLQSASLHQPRVESDLDSLIGRANRFLHWRDMLYFKSQGRNMYDFGGWYAGNADLAKLGINRFKEEFGGQIIRQYNCYAGVSTKGKLALMLKSRLK